MLWHKIGPAVLLVLWALAPAGARGQYFDPRYRLPGSPSPIRGSPPGRVSPFLGNPGYYPPNMAVPQVPQVPGWAFAEGGGGVFTPTQQGVWTLYRNQGTPTNFLELYRTPSYAELYQPASGTGLRLSNNRLYRDYAGVWYPVVQGWWQ
jgi:hypothetical protein